MKIRLPRKIKKKIPKDTPYCYTYNGKSGTTFNEEYQTYVTWYGVDSCPMSFKNEHGYNDCRFLTKSFGTVNGVHGLDLALHDNCKSCGISEGKY